MASKSLKSLLVVGGSGNLGRAIVSNFKETWNVTSLDFLKNEESHSNIVLSGKPIKDQISEIKQNFNSNKFDSIFSVAGGFAMGPINEVSIFEQIEKMNQMNVISALLAGHLATSFLQENGMVVFTGAALPFKQPTPNMLAYGLAKTGVHAIGLNLAEQQELSKESTVITILPEMIDTPQNREGMPNADFDTFVKPAAIAGLLKMWAEGKNRPKNGSFAVIKNSSGMAVPEFV